MLMSPDEMIVKIAEQELEIKRLKSLPVAGSSWGNSILSALAYVWSTHKTDVCIAVVAIAGPMMNRYMPNVPPPDPVVLQAAIDKAVQQQSPAEKIDHAKIVADAIKAMPPPVFQAGRVDSTTPPKKEE